MQVKKINNFLRNPRLIFLSLDHIGLLKWMDDKAYLNKAFKIRLGKPLNLDAPKSFNEKIQWLKIYDRNPLYTSMVDKYEAKHFVENIIGKEHVIPTYGIWEHFDQIDFDKLPNQFVLKCTHDSGGLIICRDKKKLDKKSARRKIENSLKHNYYYGQREWPYKNVKPRIIAEKYMEDSNSSEFNGVKSLTDYKFFCFNGVPQFLYVSRGLESHATARMSFYDMSGNEMPFHRSDYAPLGFMCLPAEYDEMVCIAKKIAEKVNCAFVRIDLYSINHIVYFSEITFSPCGGMVPFEPKEWDNILGEMISLPIENR